MRKIVIIGGGLSSVLAALSISSALHELGMTKNYEVILISPNLGGIPAKGLVTPMAGTHSLDGTPLLTPLAQAFVEKLMRYGEALEWEDTIGFTSKHITLNPFTLPFRVQEVLGRAGVRWLKGWVSHVAIKGNTIKASLKTFRGFEEELSADLLIDGSGENVVARSLKLELLPTTPLPASRIILAESVDWRRTLSWALKHRNEFYENTRWELVEKVLSEGGPWSLSGFQNLLQERGFKIPRDRLVMFSFFKESDVLLNVTRVGCKWNEVDNLEVQEEALNQVLYLLDFLRRFVPGFERIRLVAVGELVSRDSPRTKETIMVLKKEDLMREASEELIGSFPIGGWKVDIHRGDGIVEGEVPEKGYPVPLGIGVVKANPRLLLTGKNVSADDIAFSSVRVQGTLASFSEAIGVLGALILREGLKELKEEELFPLTQEVVRILRMRKERANELL